MGDESRSYEFKNKVVGYEVCPECGLTFNVYEVSASPQVGWNCCNKHDSTPMVFLKVLPKGGR